MIISSPLAPPSQVNSDLRRVAIVFSGGPAPAANAVISTAAVSFLRHSIEVIGVLHGYSHLVEYGPDHPLVEGRDYVRITHSTLRRTRNSQGILIGTARANPGEKVSHPSHLADPSLTRPFQAVHAALLSLGVDALISVGGDDTLKTANKFLLYQQHLPPEARRIRIVHLPKTIDNDYTGIDFTFGYFTAVDVLAGEVRNLLADAEASRTYYLAETMGRSAGWLAYGTAIAGEASLVISMEDVKGKYLAQEPVAEPKPGQPATRPIMAVEEVVRSIVDMMLTREKEGKEFGVIVMAEGLAELLPMRYLEGIPRDPHGHIAVAQVELGRRFAKLVADEYKRQTGRSRRVNGIQLGYEARCARPLAYDVILGSQLGVGAYRALVEKNLDGVMVSVSGQFELNYVSFDKLVDPNTLVTVVRYIEPESDFHKLARFLETYVYRYD